MKRLLVSRIIALTLLLGAFSPTHAYKINPKQISVSGLSSGSYMAGQLHVALSNVFMGAGLVAGGPYYCAEGDVNKAQYSCMVTYMGEPSARHLARSARSFAKHGLISSTENLKHAKVFILSGQYDRVVIPSVIQANIDFYKNMGTEEQNIHVVRDLPLGHAFPTEKYGNPCETERTPPFISRCNYDGAGAILNHIYGELRPKAQTAAANNYYFFQQNRYMKTAPRSASLNEKGIAYIPKACEAGATCKLHVALHGCKQTLDDIQDNFYAHAGYNEWAEANNIIVLYPQAIRSIELGNPNGCWDWWGYTGEDFHLQSGVQIQFIKNLIESFLNQSPEVERLSSWAH